MSYNVDSVRYIGKGRLSMTIETANALGAEVEDELAEGNFLDGFKGGVIETPQWYGDWSGRGWETFLCLLSATYGTAELVACWEGGDSYTGLRVRDGIVIEHKVVFSLGERVIIIEKGTTD